MKNHNVHFVTPYIQDPNHPLTILLIGAGGTGSRILPRLVSIDQALKEFGKPGLHVTVIDGDKVEEHNKARQNFTPSDVGHYKASRLIEKINMAFGLQWEAQNTYLDNITKDHLKYNLIISAVDNVQTRLNIKDAIAQIIAPKLKDNTTPFYWIDTGNGKDFGQVVLSTTFQRKERKTNNFTTVDNLCDVEGIFGKLEASDTKELQGMGSCSFIESIKEQDLFINDSVATETCKFIWNLLREPYITSQGTIINHSKGNRPLPIVKSLILTP